MTTEASPAPETIRDVVDVRPHPTVVRLDDLKSASSAWISEAYFLTGEVKDHLRAIEVALGRDTGRGLFLIGHYGAGKSHFLSYLVQQLQAGKLAKLPTTPVAVSLINYSSDTRLEDIVAQALSISAGPGDRRVSWARVGQDRRVLLVIDELSEFLRSKPSPAQFNEDIRFLQFMGEWAQGRAFWVIAAMQEQIEHTGDIDYALYRKIKDRYPLRLLLTPAHVRDLIAGSILRKKLGYAAAVKRLSDRLRDAYPRARFDGRTFASICPIHPATIELLEEVRDRFSQARGIIDFTVTQLAGNAERGFPPFLDRPWGSLLTPDRIVDHFLDLFEVQPELTALSQKVLPHYRTLIAESFDTESARELAWRLMKLLILAHLSPRRKGITLDEAAAWLLHAVIRTDPAKNLSIIEKSLRRLTELPGYVKEKNGRFYLEPGAEVGDSIEKLIRREAAELHAREEGVFELIVKLIGQDEFNPFALPRDEWHPRVLKWHFHDRPYMVFVGNADPPACDGARLCVRLPWGAPPPARGCYTITPRKLQAGDEIVDLAAMARLRERPQTSEIRRQLDRRISDRLPIARSLIRTSYIEATLTGPEEQSESPQRIEPESSTSSWLDRYAEWMHRRIYPSFERYAPGTGPLPVEAYRSLMRHALDHDLCEYEADDFVKTIREAYLVPMGLLQRRGRDYAVAGKLDRHELVTLLLPMLQPHPSPAVVYQRFSEPIYGLVQDQIHMLLIFLLLQGDIDILKDRASYRQLFETLHSPLQYDRIVPGRALPIEQLRELERLCDGVGVRMPKQWSVMAQRQVLRHLREMARGDEPRVHGMMLRLESLGQGESLREKCREYLRQLGSLESAANELHALEQFLFEIGSAARFLDLRAELMGLPERLDRILAEQRRWMHLLESSAFARLRDSGMRSGPPAAIGPIPPLDDLDAFDEWLDRARTLYAEHKESYAKAHDEYWRGRRSGWEWRPPRIAESRHAGVEPDVAELRERSSKAASLVCRALVNLDFQPFCGCGFDGVSAPVEDEIGAITALREKIERALRLLFQDESVKARVREWQAQKIESNPRTMAYLDGGDGLPEIENIALFDQFLSGVDLVKEVDFGAIAERLRSRTWNRNELIEALARELPQHERLRVSIGEHAEASAIASWCLEQSLAHGVPMPGGFAPRELAAAAAAAKPEWVGPRALQALESLKIGDAAEELVLQWLLDGHVHVTGRGSALVAAAADLITPEPAGSAEALAEIVRRSYAVHGRLMKAAPARWLDRMETLAQATLQDSPPQLRELLQQNAAAQWLIVDGLGAPLAQELQAEAAAVLESWRIGPIKYAMAPAGTTTDSFYRDVIDSGQVRPLTKIDVVDTLLHERFLAFDDLRRVVSAELRVALKAARRSLDPSRPLLLLADHGFRISRDGRRYEHGGGSTLERLVPTFLLVPLATHVR